MAVAAPVNDGQNIYPMDDAEAARISARIDEELRVRRLYAAPPRVLHISSF